MHNDQRIVSDYQTLPQKALTCEIKLKYTIFVSLF